MDMSQLLRALGLQQAYQAYQQNIGEPFAAVVGGAGRGYLGLDKPEYGGLLSDEAYRTGQAMGYLPALGAPAGAFKAAAQAPEFAGLLSSVIMPNIKKASNVLKEQNSFESVVDGLINSGVILDIASSKNRPNLMTISRIQVAKENRGKGIGSDALSKLTEAADQERKIISLSPSTDFGASSKARLVDFYKRFGFVENKGKNKDFSISESMYRLPTQELE